MKTSRNTVLSIIGIAGLNPYKQNKFAKFLAKLTILSCAYANLKNIGSLFTHYNGFESISELHTMPALFVVMIKAIILYIYNHDLKKLFEASTTFWPDDKFGMEVKKRIQLKRKLVSRAIMVFASVICATMIIFSFLPVIVSSNEPILTGIEECDLDSSPCFEIVHTIQVIIMVIHFAPAFGGYDVIFCYFVGEVYCSLELLKEGLKNISLSEEDVSRANKIIIEFVNQHNIILKFISNLKKFYSAVMLIIAVTSLMSYVYALYSLTIEGFPPPPNTIMKSGVIFVVFAVQMLYYCLGGTIIINQSLSVATEIFDTDWWKKVPPTIRKQLVFMIMRSQRKENLSVGNLKDLNLEFFVSILGNALSAFTLLLNIQDKKFV